MKNLAELEKHRWKTVEAEFRCDIKLSNVALFLRIHQGDRMIMNRRFLRYMDDLRNSATFYSNDEEESYLAHIRDMRITIFRSSPYARFDFYPVSRDE